MTMAVSGRREARAPGYRALLVRLLTALSDGALADAIAGDLAEERRRRSGARATLWFWRAALGVVLYLLIQRGREIVRQMIASGFGLGGNVRSELRQAMRSLRRTPWYSVTVTSVIALSIMVSATVFAVVDGVLFKPLPYPDATELYVVDPPRSVASLREVQEWAVALPDVEVVAFQRVWAFDAGVLAGTPPIRLTAAGVGAGFFEVVGTPPLFGGFAPGDFEPPGGPLPALISHGLWRRVFGGRLDVIGESLDVVGPMDGEGRVLAGYRVAGVLPPDFVYPDAGRTPDLVVPMALPPERAADRNSSSARALVRLPPGSSPDVLKARLDAVAATQGFAPSRRGVSGVYIQRIDEAVRTYEHAGFRAAFAMAAALCLLACVNISALAVAWRRQRAQDYALRAALGASRLQLTRLLLAEVATVVLLGSTVGLLGCPAAIAAVARLMPADIQLIKVPALDLRVIAFTALAAAVTIVLGAIFQSTGRQARLLARTIGRADLATTTGKNAAVRLGMIAQVAVAVVFLVGGALVVGSHWLIWQQEIGYSSDAVAVIEVYPGPGTRDEMTARADAFIDRVRAIPGVERVGVLGVKLMEGWRLRPSLRRPAGVPDRGEQSMPIDGEFFEVLGIQPLEGRLPTSQEIERADPVLVVSERVARTYWPDTAAVGQALVTTNGTTFTVIGVVPDGRFARLDQAPVGQIYFAGALPGVVLVQSRAPRDEILHAAAEAARGIGGGFGTVRALTLREAIGESIRMRTFRAWLYGAFAAAALAIAAAGILGMVAMVTARRTREIGIRRSLGATSGVIAGMLIREQAKWIGAGLVAGGLVSMWAVTLLPRYMLYQFTAHDIRLWAIALGIIAAVAAAGTLIPALRASRIDPVSALRAE
jgi:predicted permease